jgi:hypothetical protein
MHLGVVVWPVVGFQWKFLVESRNFVMKSVRARILRQGEVVPKVLGGGGNALRGSKNFVFSSSRRKRSSRMEKLYKTFRPPFSPLPFFP